MENNFLINKVKEIQNEYLDMLIKIKDEINTNNFKYIIDEINIFWYLKREIVNLYLNNITIEDNIYIFTGATYLDIDDFEHYPFIIMGKSHIVDDPLCTYSKQIYYCKSTKFFDILKNQIINSINDDIKIISQCSERIMILPLHLFYDKDMNLIKKQANDIFLSLFSEKSLTLSMYFKKFTTIQDVVLALKPGIEKNIIFDENDNVEDGIEERFFNYTTDMDLPIPKDKNDAFKFWFILFGYILQSLYIIICCSQFNLIPYLRCNVALRYFVTIGNNFNEISGIKRMIFKCQVAHLMYKIFNKERFSRISFNDFCVKLEEYNFEKKVDEDIKSYIDSIDNINVVQLVDILNKNLDRCFNDILNKI